MSKCLESGQTTRKFNNNLQFDCVEFMQSLLEHLWNKLPSANRLQETVFGGLIQENWKCECGNKENHIKRLSDVVSIPINGDTIQTCLDFYSCHTYKIQSIATMVYNACIQYNEYKLQNSCKHY